MEGPHAVAEALASPRHVVRELFVTADAARRDVELMRVAAAGDVTVTLASDRVIAALADTVTPQGVVAVVGTGTGEIPSAVSLGVLLVDVADPGNAGTVIRTADAAGADVVVLAGATVDPYNPKCVRATAGSLFHLPVVRRPVPAEAVTALRDHGAVVLATTLDADASLEQALDDAGDAAVVWMFGNEAHGLSPDVAAAADRTVRIPIYGHAESLNLAAAAAVCLYETARRRHRQP